MRNIVALVTIFNPNSSVVENVRQIAAQVSYVILSDNSSFNNSELFKSIKNCTYIFNNQNLGLSAAFNKCMNLDVAKKSDFIIFFDQDSQIEEKYIERLVSDFEFLETKTQLGILGPQYFDTSKNQVVSLPKNAKQIANNCFIVTEVITSSMLTKYEILKAVDFWNENVFLDYADFDFCWRVIQAGFYVCQDCNIVLNHSLGKNAQKMFLPVKNKYVLQNYWVPVRYYYQTREAVKLFWKKYVPKQWKRNFLIHNTIEILMHLYYLPQKCERFKYFCKGMFDGLLGKNGATK